MDARGEGDSFLEGADSSVPCKVTLLRTCLLDDKLVNSEGTPPLLTIFIYSKYKTNSGKNSDA